MKFSDFRDLFRGEHCVVVAPGPSSREPEFQGFYRSRWTIGCNRAVKYCDPDFALCVEPFRDPIWPIMRESTAALVFSHLCKDRRGRQPHPRIVEFSSKNVLDWFRPDREDRKQGLWCAMSPFWGVAVAAWLGFDVVGLVGVDLTPDRYHEVWRENEKWSGLIDVIPETTQVVNLSPRSRLNAVGKGLPDQINIKGAGWTAKV